MEPKHQFAAQYMLSRAAAERRFRDRGESPGPGTSSVSGGPNSGGPNHDGEAAPIEATATDASPATPSSPVPSVQSLSSVLMASNNRLTSPLGRSPVPATQGSMGLPGHGQLGGPMAHLGQSAMSLNDMQSTEMEEDSSNAALTAEEAAVARRLQAAGVEAVLRLAAASASGGGPTSSSVSYPDSRLEQAIRLHQALGFALPQSHPLHLHPQQLQFQQHQQQQQHHHQPLQHHHQQQQQQQSLHLGQSQLSSHAYHHQAAQHHLQHQQPPQGH